MKVQTLRRLHTRVVEMPPRPDAAPGTPSGGAYGLGSGFIEMPCSRGDVMLHKGSDSMNLAMVMVQP